MDHVPDSFFSKVFTVSGILTNKWLKKIIKETPLTGSFGFGGDMIIGILTLLFGFNKKRAIRYITIVKYGGSGEQEEVIDTLKSYYPYETGFAVLTVDMEYMGAGFPKKRFESQLQNLAKVKQKEDYKNLVYPFIFADPRRIDPKNQRDINVEDVFIRDRFLQTFKEYISTGIYQGIKIYPALGYYPFDIRMKPVYDFALEHNIPIMTHCTIGILHFKYDLTKDERTHIFKGLLPEEKPSEFQQYFTHPLNYQCLLNQELLKKAWNSESVPNYEKLKICLGHWGTGDEWHNYLENPWLEVNNDNDIDKSSEPYSLNLNNWHIGKDKYKNFSWFSIICDLMRKYDNVYADISYTLNDTSLFPLLKMILESDCKIRERVLFGTDFYVVSKAISERAFSINVRSYLGKELFDQIAIANAERYLSNNFQQVRNIGERNT
jgi:predicted TIM-barrel fold metal-dependent hydrolase